MSEVFYDGKNWWYRTMDGRWVCEDGFVEVRKGKTRLKPIRGSKVYLVDDAFLMDVKKGSSDKERIESRVRRLEEMMPYEARAMRRAARGEGVLEIGVFHGGRKEKVNVQQQPNVYHEVEEKVNAAIKQILRGEVGEFVAQKTDGGVRAREAATVRYVNKVLRDGYQKILKNQR